MDEEKAGELTAGSEANSTGADESADQETAKEDDGEPSEESLDRFDEESPQS